MMRRRSHVAGTARPRRGGAGALALALALLLAALAPDSGAQEIEFHAPASARDDHAMGAMRDLAQRVLPVYQEKHPERYLGYLSALQLVAGDYAAADATRLSLAKRRAAPTAGPAPRAAVLYDIYVHARALEARDRVPFEAIFRQTYRDVVGRLSDQDAYAVTGLPPVTLPALEGALQAAFDQRRARAGIAMTEAVDLVWMYFTYDAYRRFGALLETLGAEDDRRRYITDERIVIRTPDGARLSAVLVRPRAAAQPRPALLEFTISVAARNLARECAAHGYVGVVAYTRGRGRTAGPVVPFEHDGADAEAVIAWIAQQPWSDGRVGMYGEGYSAFTAWAAARRAPPALKAIAGSDAMAPGISFPMEGSIFQNRAYRWLTRVTGPATPDAADPGDEARWQALYLNVYRNGDPSGDLDGLLGQPSPILHRWLDHPQYDAYWQAMIPYGEQFARIDMPVLSISGYFADAQVGALYYFRAHHQYDAHADHTLLVGPYDDGATQRESARDTPAGGPGPAADPAAAVPLRELRYQWFDHVLRGGARPALLQDRVNYEVAGADTWRHAASIPAMSNGTQRYYLNRAATGYAHLLSESRGSEAAFVRQTVDLADRRDAEALAPPRADGAAEAATSGAPGGAASSAALGGRNELVFISEPLAQALEVGGLFSGRLDFLINKRDVDLTIALYERLASGQTVRLFEPAFEFRASNAGDRSRRQLLRAGVRQQLEITSERLASRMLQAGSRLVLVLGVNKRADQEINLGTGRNVRDEYVEYAGAPLEIRWFGGSYIDLPVRR
jgi:putative CocE/NonD family hydrolase